MMTKSLTLDFLIYREHDTCSVFVCDPAGEECDVTYLFSPEERVQFRVEMDESWLNEQDETRTEEAIHKRIFND